jgi:hypothetical protein
LKRFEVISNISYRTYRGGLIRTPEETLPEHLAIIDAIEKKDAELAEKLTREHSRKSQKCLMERFPTGQNGGTINLQNQKYYEKQKSTDSIQNKSYLPFFVSYVSYHLHGCLR